MPKAIVAAGFIVSVRAFPATVCAAKPFPTAFAAEDGGNAETE
jgi:hypothetical protein